MRDAPRFSHADRLAALAESQRRYAARGVTSVYEGHGIAPEVLAVYREAHERGALHLRATLAVSPTWDGPVEARHRAARGGPWAGGRGTRRRSPAGGRHLPALRRRPEVARVLHEAQPYTGWAGFVESANAHEAYVLQATLAARLGVRVNTLVTRCLPEVLDVWEAVARQHPIRDLRWVLVHLNGADAAQLARIKRLGAVATTNPISYLWRSAADEVARLGGAVDTLLPHRSLQRHRIAFGLATDNKPADPWVAFVAVVARRDMTSGQVLGPAERLSRLDALRALTVGGAWITHTERQAGVLAPGRRADLAVLEGDPLTLPLEDLPAMPVRLTMVGGALVHGRACISDRRGCGWPWPGRPSSCGPPTAGCSIC